jgi:NADH-quinone oxidoreductase subunit M
MNLIVIGIFIFSTESILGALYQTISHGFVSSALFILIGILYDRYHSRLIYYYSGLIRVMPIFTIFFIFFTLANIAFPGTSNFMGEMILLFGINLKNYFIAILSAIGIILCGLYSL